ncbi:unnamed protein product [Brassicogethes aeneus]|uniref:Uncharacterized protein n=1 Tax=Brassicogethes aeneus TaxID=1431903 RepID=A0A9P0AKU6_BRAAE|nr:unnamed protein product [Brassicogethes aeneus]
MSENIIVTKNLKYPADLPAGLGSLYFKSMQKHAKQNKIAQIVHKTGEKDSYDSLLKRCIRTALYLQEIGIKKDDVVCLVGSVHVNSCVPYIASHFIGAIPSCIAIDYPKEDKKKLVKILEPKVIFTLPEHVEEMQSICMLWNLRAKFVVFGEYKEETGFEDVNQPNPNEDKFEPVEIKNLKDTAIMYFSSGTTGLPKAICLNHFSMLINLIKDKNTENPDYDVIKHWANAVDTNFTMIEYIEYFWISAGVCLSQSIHSGFTRILLEKFEVSNFWQIVDKYKVNFAYVVANYANDLIRISIPENCNVSSLVLMLIAGTRISAECIVALRKMVHPLATVLQGYAQTEFCGANTYYDIYNKDHRRLFTEKPQSVGLPSIGYTYKVVDMTTKEILGPNKQGELLVKGPTIMNGYYKMDAKDDFDDEGFYKTGDIVYYDEDKSFYIVDRIKGAIKYKLFIVCSSDIEDILMKHPAVRQAAVFGTANPEDMNHVTAVVVVEEGSQVTQEEVREFVDGQVDDYKRIRGGVKFVKSIPITSTGKIKTSALRSLME